MARSICEQRLVERADIRPIATNQDLAPMAATTLGYLGYETYPLVFPAGDLGGWALDLLQARGNYLSPTTNTEGLDLETFMLTHLGAKGIPDNGFSYEDLVADSDAFLLATHIRNAASSELGWSNAMRVVYQMSPNERIREFYQKRFDSSTAMVAGLFGLMFENTSTQYSPEYRFVWSEVLKKASGAGRLPFQDEARTCGEALAAVMAAIDAT